MANLRDIIRELIKDNEEIYSCVCVVEEVDKDKRTCDVAPIDGSAKIFDVRLQSKVSSEIGLVMFPLTGSEVTVTFISKELAFVSCTNEIDEIKLDIGDFSLFIDSENFNKSVKNIVLNTTDYEQNSTNTEINAQNFEVNGENTTFNLSTIFEVISSVDIKLQALNMILQATNIDINGITTITGVTTVNGAATINGATAMNGTVIIDGGANGGVPKGSEITNELNKLVTDVNNLKSILSSWTPVANDGGAALKALISTYSSTTLTAVNVANISNDNVTH